MGGQSKVAKKRRQTKESSIPLGVYVMGRNLDEGNLERMGYVCTECGTVSNILKSCLKGCTKICPECLKEKGYSFVYCKKCGGMTLQTWHPR